MKIIFLQKKLYSIAIVYNSFKYYATKMYTIIKSEHMFANDDIRQCYETVHHHNITGDTVMLLRCV